MAALLVGEASLEQRWVFPAARVTLLVVLVLATVVTLAAGLVLDSGASAPNRPWHTIGLALSLAYCGVIALGVCGVALLYGINGLPPTTPPTSEILPLPPGLAVIGNNDEHCSGGSTTICTRVIFVASTTGQNSSAVTEELEAQLAAGGWRNGDGCRTVNVLLDRNVECVQVDDVRGRVSVELDDSSGW